MSLDSVLQTILPDNLIEIRSRYFRSGDTGEFIAGELHGGIDFFYEDPSLNQTKPPVYSPVNGTVVRVAGSENSVYIRDENGYIHRNPLEAGLVRTLSGYRPLLRLAEVAEAFGLASYASASATIRLLKRRLAQEAALAKTVKRIILDLTP